MLITWQSFTIMKLNQKKREEPLRIRLEILNKKLKEKKREIALLRKKRSFEIREIGKFRQALMNILEDVEEARRKAEEERDLTHAIIANFADALLFFNEKNRLSLINPKAEKFFSVKKEEVVGKPLSELSSNKYFKKILGLVGCEIKSVFREEVEMKKNFILELTTINILTEKTKKGALMILHDVSREKLVEAMKTEFVSLAAHQLRTPLSAIKWTLRIILDGDLGKINKEQRNFLEKTYKSNERMISLINDLLNVARIEEGRFLYKPVFTSLASIVENVLKSYNEQIKRKGINFVFDRPQESLSSVYIDVEKISLVIQNLIDNAIHYTPPKGNISISLKEKEKIIEFSIKDTGIGIPQEQKERIFSKFFRASNAVRAETEGSGLGLFIAKNIIEAHGGKIWFKSKEGEGSTFYFSLPIKDKRQKKG